MTVMKLCMLQPIHVAEQCSLHLDEETAPLMWKRAGQGVVLKMVRDSDRLDDELGSEMVSDFSDRSACRRGMTNFLTSIFW